MKISDQYLDNLICEIIADCSVVTPPLDRNEIASHVLDHLGPELRKQVYEALERMTQRGMVLKVKAEKDEAAVTRYALPDGSTAHH